MNYILIHDKIIKRAQERITVSGYTEKHHIIPLSFGGHKTDPSNLVTLTGREHFIIHQLLAKIYPKTGMVHAAFKIACAVKDNKKFKISSRIYNTLRKNHADRVVSDLEAHAKKSKALKGKKQSPEHILARTSARKNNGLPWTSKETSAKTGRALKGRKYPDRKRGNERSEREKEGAIKSANTRRGRKMLPEQVAKGVAARRGKKINVVVSEERKAQLSKEKSIKYPCPHCGMEGALMIMKRWHFDNCKKKAI